MLSFRTNNRYFNEYNIRFLDVYISSDEELDIFLKQTTFFFRNDIDIIFGFSITIAIIGYTNIIVARYLDYATEYYVII